MFGFFRRRRRAQLRSKPFPDAWRRILEKNVALYRRLPAEARKAVEGHIQVLVDEKRFEGCGGLTITDEMKVTIAAHAAMLLLGRARGYYPKLSSILVYPRAYVAAHRELSGRAVTEGKAGRLGESSSLGAIVLSWEDTLESGRDPKASANLAIHEFAHQLDQECGGADGTPFLGGRGYYAAWARVLGAEFERMQKGRRSLLDPYGATDPAEFFAVATETFFEKPRALLEYNAELYEQLRFFYGLDLARSDASSMTRRT